ncbi:hypothetical protein GW758_03830 [Candidatus Falkowbacteria bacterium]|nr:hypothetical protein [Candidatus Falkowbacteria bacterium]NCT55057.1 hypothetical protein [Candidatus Falkowbacteria bacterium]
MWPDDIYWMPYFLENKKFVGKFLFDRTSDDKYQAKILSLDLKAAE